MAKDVIEQVEPHVHEILRICSALNGEGRELHELNALVRRTIQNHFVELNGGVDTPCPITFAFQRLRRSDRLSSRDKRSYEAMQGANKKPGKLPKKLKLITDEAAAAEANTNENSDNNAVYERSVVDKTSSCELVGDDPTIGLATFKTTNNPTATEPNIMEPQEILDEGIHRDENDGVMAGSALTIQVDDDSGVRGSDLFAITHADKLAVLDEYFPKSATGLGPFSRLLAPEPLTPPPCIALPGSPSVWTTPSAGPDVEVLKESEIPYPERAINSVEACSSIYHSGSPKSVSSYINLTRCPSYETNATDIDSLDMAIRPPFTKREVLNDGP